MLLLAVVTDVIRLGPSRVLLTPESLTIEARWFRFPDDDSAHDYYAILVRIVNHLNEPSVHPYAIRVNLTVAGGVRVDGFHPTAGDHAEQEWVTVDYGGSPPTVVLNLPAGHIERYDGETYTLWNVTGSHGLASQPVFTESADFYAQFRLLQGSPLAARAEVLVDWFYANPLQAYPVATQGTRAVCSYVPGPDSMGPGPYGACE